MKTKSSRAVWFNVAVGVAILIVLGAVLLPYEAGDSHQTLRYRCMSNLKRLALAQFMYAADQDGRLPDATVWMDLTVRYAGGEQVLRCPTLLMEHRKAYGYAMNFVLSSQRLDDLDGPAQTPLLFDSALLVRNAACGINGQADPPRHGIGNNVVFADGNVQRVPQRSNRR